MPALDHALSVIGSLSGVPVVLGRGLAPDEALLAERLRAFGAVVRSGLEEGPNYVLGAVDEDLTDHLGATFHGPLLAQNLPVMDLS